MMERYAEYKDSGVDWLGEIPVGWEVKRLASFGRFSKGGGFSKSDLVKDGADAILYGDIYTQYDFCINKTIRKISPEVANKSIQIQPNDLLFTGSGETKEDIGKCALYCSTEPAVAGGDIILFRQIANNPLFLSFCLNAPGIVEEKAKSSKGEIIVHTYASKLRELRLSLPPLPEQTDIAGFLDEKTAKIDELVGIKRRQIALLAERKQILIQNAVTKGLDPTAPLKDSGVDWIGNIPAHWEVKRLKHLAFIRYGLGQPPKESEHGLPLLRATNVERGKINPKNLIFVEETDVPKERNAFLSKGEIIVVRSGAYTGDSAVIPPEYDGAVAGYDMVVTPFAANSDFLALSLLSAYVLFAQIYLERMRAAQPHLNREELAEILILCPPPAEQREITKDFEAQSQKIDAAIAIKEQQIEKLNEYKTTLINAAVTGKIKVA